MGTMMALKKIQGEGKIGSDMPRIIKLPLNDLND